MLDHAPRRGDRSAATLGAHLTAGDEWRGGVFTGAWRAAAAPPIPGYEPAPGAVLAEVGQAEPGEVAEIAAGASAAQAGWQLADGDERAGVMLAAAAILRQHADEVVGWLVREGGSTREKARFEVESAAVEFDAATALASGSTQHELASGDPGRRSFARRVPLGVVGVITPWNVPLLLAARSVAPALALGNAVVLKPDPQTPVAGGVVLANALAGAGLPPGAFNLVVGGAAVGEALVEEPQIDMISFTGSSAVGRRIGGLAGQRLKKLALELGGNSAFIVLDDADLERASSAGAWGSFHHQGQICMAASRHLVHESVADEYVERLSARAAALKVGDPHTDAEVAIGPLINRGQLERVDRLVTASVEAGAVLRAGGEHEGLFYRPTVLSGVAPEMDVFAEEIFGPVAPVTVFASDEEAIELANHTEYGLSAAVQSRAPQRARAIADRLRTGSVHINDQTVNDAANAPFGGRGASGNASRFGGDANWESFTQWQWVTEREEAPRFPF
jgi:benzaldehyde dehydrogenase (NAD)